MTILRRFKICMMAGNQAGILGVLTAISMGCEVMAVVSYSESLTKILKRRKIPAFKSIHHRRFIEQLKKSDLLLSVHGREIVSQKLLDLPRKGAVNVHPYLSKYKGADPVGRALKLKDFHASVGAHRMSARVDEGVVLAEQFLDIGFANCAEEIYNRLYPVYVQVIMRALEIVAKKPASFQPREKI